MADETLPRVEEESFQLLHDIPLKVSVELGQTRMLIQDLLDLGQGSVIDLERMAGEPVDVLVNGHPIARGEIVVFNDRYAVRVVSINTPVDRASSHA
jgi:flagellar motor switch protein FliN/FliY